MLASHPALANVETYHRVKLYSGIKTLDTEWKGHPVVEEGIMLVA